MTAIVYDMNIPTSWQTTEFSQIIESIVGGGTPSKTNPDYFKGTIPFMTVKDMKGRFIKTTIEKISEDALRSSAATLVPADTLVVATRMALGKIARTTKETAINQDIKAIYLSKGIDKRYVEHFWRHKAQHIESIGTGTTVKGIRLDEIRSLTIPIAPTNEQRRIADKLDRVLARVDAANEHLSRVAPLIKRFRQSVLEAAISGRLTKDWRDAHKIGKNWLETSLGAIITEMRNGISNKPDENPSGCKILRISAVRPLLLDTSDHRIISLDKETIFLYSLQKGDILFTRYNGSLEFVGACAVFPEEQETFVYPDKLIRVRIDEAIVLPQFLALTCSAKSARKQIEGFIKSSAGQKGVSGKDLKTVELALPPIAEQSEIVRRVEKLFAFADRLEERLSLAQAAVQKLTPALLAKAFRGELVPQDPNDEPASELLKRLQESRANDTKPRRARKPRATSAGESP